MDDRRDGRIDVSMLTISDDRNVFEWDSLLSESYPINSSPVKTLLKIEDLSFLSVDGKPAKLFLASHSLWSRFAKQRQATKCSSAWNDIKNDPSK
jgi:hypothetical protein